MQTLIEIPSLGYEEAWIQTEEEWAPWDLTEGATFDPTDVIAQVTIPVLAFFGDQDMRVDPIQGFSAYEQALARAGTPLSEVVLIESAGHTLNFAGSGCTDVSGRSYVPEDLDRLEAWIRGLW